ncbi:hypothetical protein QN277_006655 [Acacia crassicarpa]|uniref:Uncharacterized protein n=1 Tax=Acacia crassicarpa TaxID=499986 RepID=A0AAE1IT24_9FABA|nr:hypothetical protein QN277_006655 [Acacia crassicarpa]
MTSGAKFSYQRLQNESELDEETTLETRLKKAKAWLKFKSLAGRRRPKVRVPRLKRFLRKRSKFLRSFKVSWRKALLRLKNGQSHLNDLFGGNFLFMHCNPTPFSMSHGLYKSPPTCSTGRII